MRDVVGVSDRVLLGQISPKTPTAYHRLVPSHEVFSESMDVVHELSKGVGYGAGRLAVTSEIEGQDAVGIRQRPISREVGTV